MRESVFNGLLRGRDSQTFTLVTSIPGIVGRRFNRCSNLFRIFSMMLVFSPHSIQRPRVIRHFPGPPRSAPPQKIRAQAQGRRRAEQAECLRFQPLRSTVSPGQRHVIAEAKNSNSTPKARRTRRGWQPPLAPVFSMLYLNSSSTPRSALAPASKVAIV